MIRKCVPLLIKQWSMKFQSTEKLSSSYFAHSVEDARPPLL